MKTITKKTTVLATIKKSDVYYYKGVAMSLADYTIKLELEKQAEQARQDSRNACKASASKAQTNNDFVALYIAGKLKGNEYKNSLCTFGNVMFQNGLHFIIAFKQGKNLFVNDFAFSNRTVTERERFNDYKPFYFSSMFQKGGTFTQKQNETLLKQGKKPLPFPPVDYSNPKSYIENCLKNEIAFCITKESQKANKKIGERKSMLLESLKALQGK